MFHMLKNNRKKKNVTIVIDDYYNIISLQSWNDITII